MCRKVALHCLYVCMYACMFVCMHVCLCHSCIRVTCTVASCVQEALRCVYVCVMCACIYMHTLGSMVSICVYFHTSYMYIHIHKHVYYGRWIALHSICVYVYTSYMYIHIHKHVYYARCCLASRHLGWRTLLWSVIKPIMPACLAHHSMVCVTWPVLHNQLLLKGIILLKITWQDTAWMSVFVAQHVVCERHSSP
jgi:hypothetical protein